MDFISCCRSLVLYEYILRQNILRIIILLQKKLNFKNAVFFWKRDSMSNLWQSTYFLIQIGIHAVTNAWVNVALGEANVLRFVKDLNEWLQLTLFFRINAFLRSKTEDF